MKLKFFTKKSKRRNEKFHPQNHPRNTRNFINEITFYFIPISQLVTEI